MEVKCEYMFECMYEHVWVYVSVSTYDSKFVCHLSNYKGTNVS